MSNSAENLNVLSISCNVSNLLPYLDENPHREGLADTPNRYEKFVGEFFAQKPFNLTVFAGEGYDEMVVQTGITYYSICEHHLVPFFGYGAIAYIPDKKIVGLSKLARTLEHFSRRLQNQERITMQVADFLTEHLNPKGVGVVLTGRHLCMEMRGVRQPGAQTTTTCLKGEFKDNAKTRNEFMQVVQRNIDKSF